MTRQTYLLGWALYLSEGWYELWASRGLLSRRVRRTLPIYAKTRALVLYDRVINERY